MKYYPIRVLHIFAPNFKQRFGGPIFNWKYYFSQWNNPEVIHLVLDNEKRQIIDSREAFDFEFNGDQKVSSRWERISWIFSLTKSIIANKGKYDILHLHVLWWAGLLTGFLARRQNIPTIYESVLLDEDTPSGILKQNFGKTKVWLLSKFKGILAISDSLASDYMNNGFSNNQVHTLKNCVNTDLYRALLSENEKTTLRRKLDLSQNAIILLFVGSLIERKGIDLLIKAFIDAVAVNPNLYLLMIGPKTKHENPSIDEDLVKILSDKINNHLLSDHVNFLGLCQDREKLADYYCASDIFVFPSRNEGLPNVVLEAMSAGLPVIVSKLPGLENVIENLNNGVTVPVGDEAVLMDAIIKLSNDPILAKKLGEAAYQYIKKNHSYSNWQSQLVQIYKNLMS